MSCDPNLAGTIGAQFVGLFSSESSQIMDTGSSRLSDQLQSLQGELRSTLNSFFLSFCTFNNDLQRALIQDFQASQAAFRELIQLNNANVSLQLAMEKIEIVGVYGLFFIIFIYLLFL
ncbi:MAG: hypothetical protein CMM15_10795 [Rhodospirillaceae bacterium]|nr:hypothetical protein [Rhodospirillaceae bacterium]OUX67841.1 MAG: hypothetical protein CBD38_01050 [bacterium TMED178]|tara:strand:+ start:676 stop:1029 length:354 start_codon:yes stop_codon:yes gene_type:complete